MPLIHSVVHRQVTQNVFYTNWLGFFCFFLIKLQQDGLLQCIALWETVDKVN